jgi:hypothetical protein
VIIGRETDEERRQIPAASGSTSHKGILYYSGSTVTVYIRIVLIIYDTIAQANFRYQILFQKSISEKRNKLIMWNKITSWNANAEAKQT